ncbi:hypothetical protein [Azospirillum sp.]|uniref:hypothetical protein n=1 Tax=Azospirillum sp. TaxID=34012 RepID=UPI002D34D9CB|nr:hypothetical protein [Azospirillum sp.]HYD64993.1 hypothetical protein [Azospirillum sp.]
MRKSSCSTQALRSVRSCIRTCHATQRSGWPAASIRAALIQSRSERGERGTMRPSSQVGAGGSPSASAPSSGGGRSPRVGEDGKTSRRYAGSYSSQGVTRRCRCERRPSAAKPSVVSRV